MKDIWCLIYVIPRLYTVNVTLFSDEGSAIKKWVSIFLSATICLVMSSLMLIQFISSSSIDLYKQFSWFGQSIHIEFQQQDLMKPSCIGEDK
jgi:hypothetical protein